LVLLQGALLVCALLSLPIAAASDTWRLSLSDSIEHALRNNRELQVARVDPELGRLALSSAYAFYDPQLVVSARTESASDSGGFDPNDFSRDAIYDADSTLADVGLAGVLPSGMTYSLSGSYAASEGERNYLNFDSYKFFAGGQIQQPLLRNLWIDQPRLTIRVSRHQLRISEFGVSYLTMDIVNRVQQAYYELVRARRDLEIRQDLLDTKRQFLAGTQRKIDVGMLTAQDGLVAQAQVAIQQSQLLLASNLVQLADHDLRLLLGDFATNRSSVVILPTDRPLVVPERCDIDESWQRGLTQRPDLLQIHEEIASAKDQIRFARNQLFPSLDLVAGYNRRGASAVQTYPPTRAEASLTDAWDQLADGVAPTEMVGVVLAVPLGLSAERAAYRASRRLEAQAQLRLQQKREIVMREIADAVVSARSGWERVRAARSATLLARQALEAEERKLAGGKSEMFIVLQMQNDFALARSAEVLAEADSQKALSQLHFAEGSLLERLRIRIEFE